MGDKVSNNIVLFVISVTYLFLPLQLCYVYLEMKQNSISMYSVLLWALLLILLFSVFIEILTSLTCV